jgi:uncharacterized protein (DUF952 family)
MKKANHLLGLAKKAYNNGINRRSHRNIHCSCSNIQQRRWQNNNHTSIGKEFSTNTMIPKIVGKSTRVVETDGFSIDEFAGNVGSNDDTMSLAVVKVSKPYSEPWLTLHYDEWIAVMKGQVDCHVIDQQTQKEVKAVSAVAGDTIFIEKGQRFKPVFPVADTEYIPVCIPAFKPERCIREDEGLDDKEEEERVTKQLLELHKKNDNTAAAETTTAANTTGNNDCFLYHMCEKSLWEAAIDSDVAYFPPTFTEDGGFVHACSVPKKLIEIANHYYTSSKGDWICLKLPTAETLKNKCGIVTVFEEPKPVGATDPVKEEGETALFPHIHGGIVPGIVIGTYPIERDPTNGTFLGITGLAK